ncbi:MAG: UDP-N-acetylglucosamine 1-carboxyvinyltransferase [Clostridia bacterium]|nr:UDP-N-acetylglucosamine 1-carboxyvinyltransferase [Clostridia bacterium]
MSKFIIKGGKRLEGEVKISGSKNAALPIIAATILNSGKTTLYNVPNIKDVQTMYKILKEIGAKVVQKNNKVIIDTSKIHRYEIPEELMRKMRSSVILAGAIIGKYKKAKFTYPGGCEIGSRPIDLHLKGFEKLGISIKEEYGEIICEADKIVGTQINLDFPSVGATENIILASCLGDGITVITNAAKEPEIEDLCKFLNKMGAKIKGIGTDRIEINGVKALKDVSYNIMPDRIEAGTYLIAGAITGGNIRIVNANPNHIEPILNKLEEVNCKINIEKSTIELVAPKRVKSIDIKTMPYPGFPTDMQSVFATLLTTAKGTSIVTENIFESRYKYIQELNRMGAKIKVEGRNAIIKGTKKIQAANVIATDLRGGAAMVIEALVAKGITQIDNADYILRGYDNMEGKLRMLGAQIFLELD